MKQKEKYEAPSTLVIKVRQEDVICASSNQVLWIGSWLGAGDPGNVNGLSDFSWHNEYEE